MSAPIRRAGAARSRAGIGAPSRLALGERLRGACQPLSRRARRAARPPRRAARPARAPPAPAGPRRPAWPAPPRVGGDLLGVLAQQVRVALLALARPPVQPRDELALDQPLEHLVHLYGAVEVVQPVGAREQLPRRLRAAQHQHREQGLLLAADLQRLVEQVAVLGGAAGVAAGEPRPAPLAEAVERVADRGLVVVHDRVAVGRLVAGQAKGVEGERVGVRRRALLLEQAAEDAQLGGREVMHGAQPTDLPTPAQR